MKAIYAILASAGMLTAASAAQAAQSDYFLKIEGVEGEAAVAGWSFGVCNSGQCSTVKSPRDAASGLATGKRQHGPVRVTASQNTQSLRESPSKASDGKTAAPKANWDLATGKGARTAGSGGAGGQVAIATGDVDGDGMADLAFAGTQNEISDFTVSYQKIEGVWRAMCDGKHFDKAVLRSAADSFELSDVTVSCDAAPSGPAERRRDTCTSNDLDCRAVSDGTFVMRFTGGRMTNAKTGHVTLIKQ
ncbi:MAG: hypothetical protein ABL926_07635 [Novosphingobium sp.]|uniref:hypothetical protein n=1 Tax=Novosphingobium sp. TaxID=1874826 RepID=UPI0032B852EC